LNLNPLGVSKVLQGSTLWYSLARMIHFAAKMRKSRKPPFGESATIRR